MKISEGRSRGVDGMGVKRERRKERRDGKEVNIE